MADLESILQFLEDRFAFHDFPDYPNALNGLQVQGPREVTRVAAAVDAAEITIREAVDRGTDLLVVHHGLFWDGSRPITGARYRKVAALLAGRTALFSLHLPLDAHPDLGNCILLTRAMGLEPSGRFGTFQGEEIGWWARADLHREDLGRRMEEAVGEEVRLIPGGPERVERVGIVTGGGASSLEEAARAGLDALVTGEGAHHHYHQAMEVGVNLFLGGHYATETFGVEALVRELTEKFGVEGDFIDVPTGL